MRRRLAKNDFLPLAFAALFCLLSACAAERAAPVHNLGTRLDSAAGAGAVMVREGETLWSISQRYRLALRDIIDLNNLKPPYHLRDGQRLRLPPPMEHRVGARDTLSGVARMYGVSASQLAQLNSISAPYRLRAGQVLRIPSSLRRQEARRVAAAAPVAPVAPVTAAPLAPAVLQKPSPEAAPPEAARPVTVATGKVSPQGFIWPVRGKVISRYGPKAGHLHNDGINIAAPRGTPVAAAAGGTVAYVGDGLKGYGNLVLIRHGNGMVTAYAHLDRVTVRRNQAVRRGQGIGTVGSTGTVANAQLHFEIRRGIETLDPAGYLSNS